MSNNDTNTLNGALQELGETMADNLVSMGVVDASASDGLTTLAGRILDIEPSIGGLDLDTAVTISSSESSISLGSSIVLTSKLTASYDDETIADVDLSGVLQNATLLFKNGNTTIGTAVTDVNGVATFTYTPPAIGTLSLKAIFAGTDNFNNCESSFINVTVVAPSYDDIVLTADDSILSYYDGDSTTLRAQLMDGSSTASVSGVTVEFFNGSTSLGTAQTDSTGMATKTYTSTGAGDVSLKAEADNGTLSSETFVLEDCWNTAINEQTINCTSSSKYTSIGLNSIHNIQNDDFALEFDSKGNGTLSVGHSSYYQSTTNYRATLGTADAKHYYSTRSTSTSESYGGTYSSDTYYHYKLTREGSTIKFYVNDELIGTKTASFFSNYSTWCIYSIIWGANTTQYVKNVRIKPL